MQAKINPAEVKTLKTKKGDPYLFVKTVSGKVLKSWNNYQYCWHLIHVGEEIVVEITQEGDYIYIVGVVGVEPQNAIERQILATGGLPASSPNAWDALWLRLDKLDEKISWLVEERKTLGLPEERIGFPKISWPDGKEPKLSDLPVTDLPDLND